MDYRVSAEDRAAFKRCRRQWDLGSPNRQNLRPIGAAPADLNRAVRDALAVYYYPGMWDWQSHIVLPLVRKAFMRSMAAAAPSAQRTAGVDAGTELLELYFAWAPSLEDLGPLKIEEDVGSLVPNRTEPDRALQTADGRRVLYTERVALVGVDGSDECWVVSHHVVDEWRDVESLLLDEAAIAACWAWEQTYLGMDVAGTVHIEILRSPPAGLGDPPAETRTGRPGRGGYSQNEPSGGGRITPQLHRPDRMTEPTGERIRQETAGILRRTRIRRSRAELDAARRQLSLEVPEMLSEQLALYPTASATHCPGCAFVAPCLTMFEGADPTLDLTSRFERGPDPQAYEPRLGSGGGGGRTAAVRPPPPRGG